MDNKSSRRFKRRLDDEVGVRCGKTEETTSARVTACSDIYNTVSFAAAMHAIVKNINPVLHLNADATMYAVGGTGGDPVRVKYVVKRPPSLKAKSVTKKGGFIKDTIKFYLLISAAGWQGPPIYIIADECMNKEDLDVHQVHGIGIGTGPVRCFLSFERM